MSIQVPNLDDRTFDDLVREGLSLLPVYAPEWTNHNPSDPGITLIELLAYFTEMLVYRLGRVTPASKLQFLRLLKGADWSLPEGGELQRAIEGAVRELAHMNCAITAQDFERLALEVAGADSAERALCIPGMDLRHRESGVEQLTDPGSVSVMVVPRSGQTKEAADSLLHEITTKLLPCCLLTTRLHVISPVYLHVAIGMRVAPRPGVAMAALARAVDEALEEQFGPGLGQGPQGQGWPFGRPLYVSELVETLDRIASIDYVEDVTVLQLATREAGLDARAASVGVQIGIRSRLNEDAWLGGSSDGGVNRIERDDTGKLSAIVLRPWELPRVSVARDGIVEIGAEERRSASGRSYGR